MVDCLLFEGRLRRMHRPPLLDVGGGSTYDMYTSSS